MSSDNSQGPNRTRLRLRIDGVSQTFHLRAFPTSHPNTTVYLRTKIPAIADYVLGDAATLQLVRKASHQVLYPPVKNWSDDDETALAIRIIRASGIVFDISQIRHSIGTFDPSLAEFQVQYFEMEKERKYMFGWPPDSAGVWVLQLPEWETYDPLERWPPDSDGETPNTLWRNYNGGLETTPLEDCDNMKDLCDKMKELGAQYYADAKKSKEVMDCRLFDEQSVLHARYGWAVLQLEEQIQASSKKKESSAFMSCNPL